MTRDILVQKEGECKGKHNRITLINLYFCNILKIQQKNREEVVIMRKKFLMSGVLLIGALGLVGCTDNEQEIEQQEAETVEVTDDETADIETENTVNDPADTANYTGDVEAQYTTSINQDLIDEHENIYQEIREDFEDGDYTLEEPLVVQDPYDRAPLTGLVLFETEEPMEITVSVEGQIEETTITHTYEGYETEHEVPVLGLYPEFENQVRIAAESEDGEIEETLLTMKIEATPEDLLDFTIIESDPERMGEGLTFTTPSRTFPAGVDSNGDVRWYGSVRVGHHLKRLENGLLMMSTIEDDDDYTDYLNEADMLGKVHQSIKIELENINEDGSKPLHHDVIILPNDNYLALLHDGSGEYLEDEIAEIDRETGEVVNRINLKDVFPREMYEEYDGYQADVGDWMHVNTVVMVEEEDAILLSARNQDAVIKLSYPEGELEWLLSPSQDWPEELEGHLLEAIGEDFKYQAGQHAVEQMPDQDGNEETIDIMIFDNNRVFTRGDEELSTEFSRAVQYRINEVNQTVEEIWSYGEERGTDFYSDIVSDADYLSESETVLINSGRVQDENSDEVYSMIVEVTKTEEPEVVYEVHYGPFGVDGMSGYVQMYRAERLSLYP